MAAPERRDFADLGVVAEDGEERDDDGEERDDDEDDGNGGDEEDGDGCDARSGNDEEEDIVPLAETVRCGDIIGGASSK